MTLFENNLVVFCCYCPKTMQTYIRLRSSEAYKCHDFDGLVAQNIQTIPTDGKSYGCVVTDLIGWEEVTEDDEE